MNPYSGKMDEVRVWTRALGQCEIEANKSCEVPTTGTGLVANYNFNQGTAAEANTGTALNDASGNSNTGTLNGFALVGTTSNWAAPGGVATGTSCAACTAPEINTQGNSATILDGDNSPSTADHTDFNGVGTRTFNIQNTGSVVLEVASVIISGTGASSFSVTTPPVSPVPAGGSTPFVVTYAPSAGVHLATLTINNADCEEAAYDFDIKAEGLVLPVELVSFTGKAIMDSYNLLEWATASETNNEGFFVERRTVDGSGWTEIGFIEGHGSTLEAQSYFFTDGVPLPGTNYYRLRQVDFDGSTQLSHIVTIERQGDAFSLVNVFPVPASKEVTLQVNSPDEMELTVTVTDFFDRVISIRKTISQRGINNLSVDLGNIAPGVYFVQVGNGIFKVTGRVVKQ